jgi:uncharacterized protein YcnI
MVLGAVLSLAATQTSAQIALSQTTFEAGTDFAAFFQVAHGCGSSPTTALRVQIPDGVEVLRLPEKPGWSVSAERTRGRMVAAVTWKGSLEAEQPDQFGLFVRLPQRTGPLYFAATQRCATQEIRWTEIPAEGVAHPAPMLMLVAATGRRHRAPPPGSPM